jgi:hypothetical protein
MATMVAAVSIALLVAASIVVGLRLLALYRRSGAAPELLLALNLLLAVGVGYPALIAADRAGPGLVQAWLIIVATLGIDCGMALVFEFTRRVFRPQALWARSAASAGTLVLLGHAGWRCWEVLTQADVQVAGALGPALVQVTGMTLAYAWTGGESLWQHGLMRRRATLGLVDPTVSNRLLLWGLTAVAVVAGMLLNGAAIALRIPFLERPEILLASSLAGLVQAVFLTLAFSPPRFYLSWMRAGREGARHG